MSQGSSKVVVRVLAECFMGVLKTFYLCFKGDPIMFHECFKDISEEFQGWFNDVFRKFRRCGVKCQACVGHFLKDSLPQPR